MKITQAFEVGQAISQVWEAFQDIPEVAKCLPGAELSSDEGGGVYKGRVEARLGPMTVSFDGTATVESDEASHTGTITGSGADRKGGSRGRMKVDYALAPSEGGTTVTVDADVHLSGPAAQFGRVGLIKEMSTRLINDFTECLEAKLAASTVEEATAIAADEVEGGALFFSSLWAMLMRGLKRLFGKAD